MAEPTLGQRIMDAAMRWAFDRALCGIEVGRESEDQLRALCARADAAERGMVAVDTAAGDREVNDWSYDARRLDEYKNALAAWRAITEEVGG